jgi:hypothetical protein
MMIVGLQIDSWADDLSLGLSNEPIENLAVKAGGRDHYPVIHNFFGIKQWLKCSFVTPTVIWEAGEPATWAQDLLSTFGNGVLIVEVGKLDYQVFFLSSHF